MGAVKNILAKVFPFPNLSFNNTILIYLNLESIA